LSGSRVVKEKAGAIKAASDDLPYLEGSTGRLNPVEESGTPQDSKGYRRSHCTLRGLRVVKE
jgi:hypothetical protein